MPSIQVVVNELLGLGSWRLHEKQGIKNKVDCIDNCIHGITERERD